MSAEGSEIQNICNVLSIAVWGLVMTKAKSGLSATEQGKTSSSVKGLFSKAATMIALITTASLLKFMGEKKMANLQFFQSSSSTSASASASAKNTVAASPSSSGGRSLKAALEDPASLTEELLELEEPKLGKRAKKGKKGRKGKKNQDGADAEKTGKGRRGGRRGRRNNQVVLAADKPVTQSYFDEGSSHYMGGAANYALSMMSNKPTTQKVNLTRNMQNQVEFFRNKFTSGGFKGQRLTDSQFKRNLKETGAFLAFLVTGFFSIMYFVTFKTYHAALERHEKLTKLVKNPNARVAVGDQGEAVLKSIKSSQKVKAAAN